MCNCITEIQDLLTKKMIEQYPDWEVIDHVEFQNISYLFGTKTGVNVFNNPVLGRVRKGKQTRKFENHMLPIYCPFCGEKYKFE